MFSYNKAFSSQVMTASLSAGVLNSLCSNATPVYSMCSTARIFDSHDHASTQNFLQHCKNSVQPCTNRIPVRLQSADLWPSGPPSLSLVPLMVGVYDGQDGMR